MNTITILPDKHIGIFFQPRSGSSLLRGFLSDITNRVNLSEWFNHTIDTVKVNATPTGFTTLRLAENKTTLSDEQLCQRSRDHIALLTPLSDNKIYTVFNILPRSYSDTFPELTALLAEQTSVQFIRVDRADLLYAFLSVYVARLSDTWHRIAGLPSKERKDVKFKINTTVLLADLTSYIEERDIIAKNFNNMPTVYYEQFQSSPGFLHTLFDGIPHQLISIPLLKSYVRYKDLVLNLNEVEHVYEKFVNEHKEYFPQYFGKMPHVQIPACQGRQPRNLSPIQLAV